MLSATIDVDKLTVKGSTGKRRSNSYVALSYERREEVKKRQREAYYRKKIANKTLLLEDEKKSPYFSCER